MTPEQIEDLIEALAERDACNVTLVVVPSTNSHDVEVQRLRSLQLVLNGGPGEHMKCDRMFAFVKSLAGRGLDGDV